MVNHWVIVAVCPVLVESHGLPPLLMTQCKVYSLSYAYFLCKPILKTGYTLNLYAITPLPRYTFMPLDLN